MPTWRTESVGRQIREIVSEIIHRRLKDPRLGFVTVTGVRVSRGLKTAKVYVSVMGDSEAKDETLRALSHALPFVRKTLGSRVRLRHTPEILFEYDDSIQRGSRIDRLLEDLKS
jgi:ribosome-binding factor A